MIPLQAVHFILIRVAHFILIRPVHLKVIWTVHLKCRNQIIPIYFPFHCPPGGVGRTRSHCFSSVRSRSAYGAVQSLGRRRAGGRRVAQGLPRSHGRERPSSGRCVRRQDARIPPTLKARGTSGIPQTEYGTALTDLAYLFWFLYASSGSSGAQRKQVPLAANCYTIPMGLC